MKTKRIFAGILSTVMCFSVMTACTQQNENKSEDKSKVSEQSSKTEESKSDEESSKTEESKTDEQSSKVEESKADENSGTSDSNTYTLVIRDADKSSDITAVFMNTQSGDTKEVKMTKTGEDGECFTFTCDEDPSAYNMFHLKYNGQETNDVTFNTFIEAWYLCERELLPCKKDGVYVETPVYKTVDLKFNGYSKNVHIWTPENYDANSDSKYAVIYMLDGQTVINAELDPGNNRSWSVAQHVTSMMDVTDNKAILVCVETMGSADEKFGRDDELIPDLGFSDEVKAESGCDYLGKQFGDYMSGTVVPYIEENYNVYKDAEHRSICGSSLGGLASFYIGLDHPETFGTVGALSSSFSVGDEEMWGKFLMPKLGSDNVPMIFMYDGSYYSDNGAFSEMMNNALVSNGYPKDKIVFCKYEPGIHTVPCWSAIYPQFLEVMFTHKLAAVKSGETVEYIDKSKQHPALDPNRSKPNEEIENDTRPDNIKNYVFFDNSETKWEKVYLYVWNGMPVNKITGEAFDKKYSAWPGFEMEKIEGTDIYRFPVPLGVPNIIFSSGIKDEDVAKGVIAYQTSDLAFSDVDNSGKIYKINTSVEPKQGSGKAERTKYKYMEGEWVDYKEE